MQQPLSSGPYANPSPGPFDNPNVYGAPVYGGPGATSFPSTAYPAPVPSTLFPNGIMNSGPFDPGFWNAGPVYEAYRLFQGPRIRHGYVTRGNDPSDLNMNDTDLSAVFAFPRFVYSTQPLNVIPSFSLHLWDGPHGTIGADLPSRAYSGFLDVGWQSDPYKMFSTEFGVRIGAFTDFDTFNSKSMRILGKALAHFRLTPASTLRAGVIYLDRNSIKLVPAGGILWNKNPYTRIDLYFPQPKYSRYCRTVGVYDMWWYLFGDYGGGSWTIQRTSGDEDSVDINDIRAIVGLEWGRTEEIRAGRRLGFVELGYVFRREVKYRYNPSDNFKPRDAIMIRAGIGY